MKSLVRRFIRKSTETSESRGSCKHEWQVVGTVISESALQTQCKRCGLFGSVPDPSEEEWDLAFDAPDSPYDWNEHERVETAFETVGEWMDAAKRNS